MAILLKSDNVKEFELNIISEIENGAKEIGIDLDKYIKMNQIDFIRLMQLVQAHHMQNAPNITLFKENSLNKFNFEIKDVTCGFNLYVCEVKDNIESDIVIKLY